MLMEKTLFRFWKFCNRRWVKWTLVTIFVLAVTVAHFVMYGKYGGTEKSPAWEFTLALHSVLVVAALLMIVIYKKYIKRKLLEHYGTKD